METAESLRSACTDMRPGPAKCRRVDKGTSNGISEVHLIRTARPSGWELPPKKISDRLGREIHVAFGILLSSAL